MLLHFGTLNCVFFFLQMSSRQQFFFVLASEPAVSFATKCSERYRVLYGTVNILTIPYLNVADISLVEDLA